MPSSSLFRIIHITDLHITLRPSWRDMFYMKRWVGVTNLWGRGRASRFSPAVQQQLISTIPSLHPSLLLVTGDITSQSLPSEFQQAHTLLHPLLTSIPTVMLHGNHDTYIPGAYQQMWDIFHTYMCNRDWQHPHDQYHIRATSDIDDALHHLTGDDSTYPHMIHLSHNITVITLSPCQPRWISSHGTYQETQLMKLQLMLDHDDLAGRYIILATHYPLFGPDGKEYGHPSAKALEVDRVYMLHVTCYMLHAACCMLHIACCLLSCHVMSCHATPYSCSYPKSSPSFLSYMSLLTRTRHRLHGVNNGDLLLQALRTVKHPPELIVHGHRHQGYAYCWNKNSKQGLGEGGGIINNHQHTYASQPTHIPIYDPGSCGLSAGAAFNVYDITSPLHSSPLAGVLFHDHETQMRVTRYVHDGTSFKPQDRPYQELDIKT